MNVSEQLARYDYEIPSQNIKSGTTQAFDRQFVINTFLTWHCSYIDIKPSQGDLKAHCKHEDLKPRITSDLDRKPSKSEPDELLTIYDRSSTAKSMFQFNRYYHLVMLHWMTEEEAEDVKVLLPVKREYVDEDTRGELL